jgi:hypothetical protein
VQARVGAVELFHHAGPYTPYGLLGATHHPSASADRELTVLVHVSTPSGAAFTESLARSFDDVQIGLPHEYVRGVIDGVSEVHGEIGGLAAGKLVFDCAAHGAIGSSLAFFQRLSRIVCRLLSAEHAQPSEDEILRYLT